MARNDPLRNFRFRLEIDQITQAISAKSQSARRTTDADRLSRGQRADARPQAARPHQIRQHHAQMGRDRFHRALRMAQEDRRRPDRGSAQERQDHRDRRIGRRQGELPRLEAWPTKYDPSDLNGKGNEVSSRCSSW